MDDKIFMRWFQKILWAMGVGQELRSCTYEDDNKWKAAKHYLADIDVYGEVIQPIFS